MTTTDETEDFVDPLGPGDEPVVVLTHNGSFVGVATNRTDVVVQVADVTDDQSSSVVGYSPPIQVDLRPLPSTAEAMEELIRSLAE